MLNFKKKNKPTDVKPTSKSWNFSKKKTYYDGYISTVIKIEKLEVFIWFFLRIRTDANKGKIRNQKSKIFPIHKLMAYFQQKIGQKIIALKIIEIANFLKRWKAGNRSES